MNNLWGDSLSGFWSAWIIVITLGSIGPVSYTHLTLPTTPYV